MYQSYFGLKEKPFQLSPDPKFFFASNHHKRALSYLQYGLDQGEGFIVITGPIGTGKTTIAKSLLQNIEDDNIVAIQIVTSNLTPEALLKLIASELGAFFSSDNKADILKGIEDFLSTLHSQGKRALLIVDEAQNLPAETIEELRMLSNFQKEAKPLLQSFLLGQEELKDIIQKPNMEQFRQRIIASAHLKPLSEDDVKQYVNHRLAHAGCKFEQLFTDDALRIVHEKTGGVPRKINIFVDRLLLFTFLEELTTIDTEQVETVAQEMDVELTGSINQHQTIDDNNAVAHHASSAQILQELESLLDDTIAEKTQTLRYVDKLLKQKNRELAEANINLAKNADG
ncbi:XrtA/PEP-CTERM system-associated ATPase [Thalassotalea agarivorans]|uniref:Putative secretion ATPase, PEP-CTERM locus subfamily n=1 Tax=Thalassotalea agarivorans TaxID=349064 RepID=A0A1I0DXD8_THASX|nr:XrtA/PEP-CTERM system-associated ATPase [Thalassotalea agarivorans]SET37360.1 putative secretion ATPase, PEP-CTERM locus subfamily [Thalassotalea agarivorans]